jgi:hypothetical protein
MEAPELKYVQELPRVLPTGPRSPHTAVVPVVVCVVPHLPLVEIY